MLPGTTLRVTFAPDRRFGPGKARLLELIAEHGSISAAARSMGMSYRRAWLLVEEMNALCAEQLVESRAGGTKGGGAALTPKGQAVLHAYRHLVDQTTGSEAFRTFADLFAAEPVYRP
jgi:molybdate transport system regulatory protein